MRVTERIVAWDALLVCLILIRLLGLHGQAQLGIVSSLWIDFDCVPHRACEYRKNMHISKIIFLTRVWKELPPQGSAKFQDVLQ